MSSLDYLDLCRLCLVKDRVSVPIFEGEGDVRQIFLKIAACLPVKVAREDKLPKKICDDCVYKVELLYQFWNTTANAEKQLLQWLGDVSLDDKQGYVTSHSASLMKPGQNPVENRLDGSVMQQVNDHSNNMGMGMMDSMGMGMPMMISTSGQQQQTQQQQQMTSVPMDAGGNTVQNVQAVPGPSAQSSHEQIAQQKVVDPSSNQDEDEDESEEDENSDDECDGDDGLPVKEESEEDPNNSRTIEPTTFVNVSLACDEAGPSGLQQQKIGEMPEMVMPTTDGDPKSGRTRLSYCNKKKTSGRAKSTSSKMETTCEKKTTTSESSTRKSNSAESSSELASRLKSVRPKRKVDSSMDEKVPPKKRRSSRRKITSKSPTKKFIDFETDSEEDMDESSHDYWLDSDEELPKPTKTEATKTTKADESSHDYWQDSDEELLKPIEAKTEKGYDCLACETSFALRRDYNKHMAKHNNLRPYECPTCKKKFKYNVGLKKHIESQHSENAPNFACDMCEFTTKQSHYLQEHFTRKHTEEYKYQCSICGKNFKAERDYKAHMSNHETGPQVCDICGVSYPNKISLYSHKNYKHTDKIKPFECKVCQKRLRTEKNLESHMQQHNQTYVCEECGMKFARQAGLTKHRKVHGEKTILCPVCGRAFACMTTQRVHMVTHSDIRPYICDVCGCSYTQRSSLMLHWRKKHPDASQPPPPVTLKNISATVKSGKD